MASFNNLNKVILIGNLGGDPEVRTVGNGNKVTSFTLATNEYWTDKQGQRQQRTEWHKIVAWGKVGEDCAKYLSKGSQCLVEGKLKYRTWTDKQGNEKLSTDIEISRLVVLGDTRKKEEPKSNPVEDDDLPF